MGQVAQGVGLLRFDDLVHLAPADVSLTNGTLELILRQSKTTGAGKKVEVIHAFVAEGSFLAVPHWLTTGFKIFQKLSADIS